MGKMNLLQNSDVFEWEVYLIHDHLKNISTKEKSCVDSKTAVSYILNFGNPISNHFNIFL